MVNMKILISTFICLFCLTSFYAAAKELGVYGQTFDIAEVDMIVWFKSRLAELQKSGELKGKLKQMQGNVKEHAIRPIPVPGLTTTANPAAYFVDPTIVVPRDIYDTSGKVVVRKGVKVNPFKAQYLSQYNWHWAFFDGDDIRQIKWAKKMLSEYPNSVKLVLVNGDISKVSKELHQHIYFDQRGYFSEKLKLKHVPSFAFREQYQWKIQEYDAGKYL